MMPEADLGMGLGFQVREGFGLPLSGSPYGPRSPCVTQQSERAYKHLGHPKTTTKHDQLHFRWHSCCFMSDRVVKFSTHATYDVWKSSSGGDISAMADWGAVQCNV